VGEEVDARSDIFSLGVVLYEMATGQPPFRGKTPAGIMGSILTESPAKPSSVNAAIPAKLDRVILKALEKEREVRYQSVASLSADLEEWRRSEAAGATRRTRRWMLTAAGAGAASLAGGAFFARRWLFSPDARIIVAVLPFENIGGNPQEAFLADGLHQDMISVLNRLYPDRLGVIARASVNRYKDRAGPQGDLCCGRRGSADGRPNPHHRPLDPGTRPDDALERHLQPRVGTDRGRTG
jgi:hypothetical protein